MASVHSDTNMIFFLMSSRFKTKLLVFYVDKIQLSDTLLL